MNKKKKNQKRRKQQKKKNEELACRQEEIVCDSGVPEEIVCEIWSRLPVKSLMKFKGVCKHWQSIIGKDQFFRDLHLSRSVTARRISFLLVGETISRKRDRMCLLSAELLLPSNDEDGCSVEVGATCLWEPPVPGKHPVSVCNGLICFMDTESYCARVYNSSTRESTSWIKSIVLQTHEVYSNSSIEEDITLIFLRHEIGYDPVTKEHKVIALWIERRKFCDGDLVCEVMTVGQNSWRKIDAIDLISPGKIRSSVYVNGSIYLLLDNWADGYEVFSIVEFSVGSEKFRLLDGTVPNPYRFGTELIEVNGRLCMLTVKDSTNKSMFYAHDENVEDKKSKMTITMSNRMSSDDAAGSSNYHWVEKTLSLPHVLPLNSIRHIPGTNLFIIRSIDDVFSIYQYNQENRSYSIGKINSEISTTLRDENGKRRYYFEFYTFTPNLLPVN